MDAKRIVPMLFVRRGRVVDPGTGEDLGDPVAWACRLEMEGADEVLFSADEVGPWIQAVTGNLFIPFLLEAPLGTDEILAAGADRRVVPADWLPQPGESDRGIVVRAESGASLKLLQGAVEVLVACADPGLAAEVLAQGADGVTFPAGLMPANAFKRRLAETGIVLRS